MRLPAPNADELDHSARLLALVHEEIRARGPIPFARFMQLALYAPGLGYYSAGKTKFGAAGDFVTAPELGSVFGRCLARALAPLLEPERGELLELGAGSGALAATLLAEWARLGCLPARYRILETSADLRARQRALIETRLPALAARVEWLERPPDEAWQGVLLANEVVDALPVTAIEWRDGAIFERCVALDAADRLAWSEHPASVDIDLRARAARTSGGGTWPSPYRTELRPDLEAWFATVAGGLERGLALFIDYGYAETEYYAPVRREGTLRCHYRQRAHDDPLVLIGLQDITASVDFTALARAGRAEGFAPIAYLDQYQFLLAAGLPQLLTESAETEPVAQQRLASEVKRLMLPGEMGERFKVLALACGGPLPTLAFSTGDAAVRLGLEPA
jgi:SAM-dependent MidA family methyltransferase